MSAPTPRPEALLPHRAPMLLLDEIVNHDAVRASARVTIRRDSPFFDRERDGVPAWIGIEYLAQTIAAWSGARRHQRGEAPAIGLLLGSRDYHCNRDSFPLHSTLRLDIELLFEDDAGLGAFACELRGTTADGETVVASGRLSALNSHEGAPACRSADALIAAGNPIDDQAHNNAVPKE